MGWLIPRAARFTYKAGVENKDAKISSRHASILKYGSLKLHWSSSIRNHWNFGIDVFLGLKQKLRHGMHGAKLCFTRNIRQPPTKD
jgi:hypothetical protein